MANFDITAAGSPLNFTGTTQGGANSSVKIDATHYIDFWTNPGENVGR